MVGRADERSSARVGVDRRVVLDVVRDPGALVRVQELVADARDVRVDEPRERELAPPVEVLDDAARVLRR